MTAETDSDLHTADAAHEPARRSGSIVLVLLVAGAIVAAASAFMTLGRAQAQPYILGLLALLAMVGLFNLFAFAAGIIRFADRSADDPICARSPITPSTASPSPIRAATSSMPTPPIWR